MSVKPLRFHPSVQRDVCEAMEHYSSISESLAEGLWNELQGAFGEVVNAPTAHHFDPSGLRRFNLKRFPYHILYIVKEDRIRIQVVRHNSRRPSFGIQRSKG